MNDYSFFSAPQLKRGPLGSRMGSIWIQSFLRYLLMGGILVVLALTKSSPGPVPWVLLAALGVLMLSAFFWSRCPHCRARVVQFNKREWLVGEFCWRCGRPYDEARTPAYAAELDRAMEEGMKLSKKDPAAFERMMLEAGRRYDEAWEAEKATLRERARSDENAARILRGLLETDLKGLLKERKRLTRELEKDARVGETLDNLERHIREVEGELSLIEATIPVLTRRS